MGVCDLSIERLRYSKHWKRRHKRLEKLRTKSQSRFPEPSNSNVSSWSDEHPPMDLRLLEAAKQGNVENFITALEKYSEETRLPILTIFSQRTPQHDTFLHLAASCGHEELTGFILHHFRDLRDLKNNKGDTVLHLAARIGHFGIVQILLAFISNEFYMTSWDHQIDVLPVNKEGNTALHEALLGNHKDVAKQMLEYHAGEAYYANKEGESGLYLAVKAGDIEFVKSVLDTTYSDQNVLDEQLTKGKSIIHATIALKNIEMLQLIAERKPMLLHVKDENGKNPLEFASLTCFSEGVNYLCVVLNKDVTETNVGDSNQVMLHESPNSFATTTVGAEDLKIEDIRHDSTYWDGRHERLKKLMATSSVHILPEQAVDPLSMDLNLHMAAKKGDIDGFINALTTLSEEKNLPLPTIFNQMTPLQNTLLHVAAGFGNEDLTGFIAHHFRNLLTRTNQKGNTALHEAASAGYKGVVDILVRFKSNKLQKESPFGFDLESNDKSLHGKLRESVVANNEGNTPLHEALINNHEEVAMYLINDNIVESYYVNKEGKSSLYMAVECGNIDFVDFIMFMSNVLYSDDVHDVLDELGEGKSLIHAAVLAKSIVILQQIAKLRPALIHVHEYGQNPLHYAASTGFLDGVNCLLNEFKMNAFERDANGLFPIHLASKNGHLHILQNLLQHCPDAREFVNNKGQTILHIAAMHGKDNIVRYILKTPGLERLINERDEDGNTPLQLATVNWHPKVVSSLTWDRRVNLKLQNCDGLTALDIAEVYMETMPAYRKRLTWMALKSAGAPSAKLRKIPKLNRLKSEEYEPEPYNMDYCKDRVNTLLLVATLVATVAFAAGFTMPGGYNNNDPNQGMAALLNNHKFQVFVICDTIAMYSAILVIVTLIWAQLGDLDLVLNALQLAIPLLGVSLTMMSLAFMVSVYLVVSKLIWLADVVIIMGIIALASILTLFFPLCLPYTSSFLISRYISYYPFRLLILASASYSDRDLEDLSYCSDRDVDDNSTSQSQSSMSP